MFHGKIMVKYMKRKEMPRCLWVTGNYSFLQ